MLVHTKDRCKVPSAIFHLWLTEARHTEHADGGADCNLRVRNVERSPEQPETLRDVKALHKKEFGLCMMVTSEGELR